MRQKVLAILEHALGQNHPDVALCLAGMADTYIILEKFDLAEQCNRRALAIYEQIEGFDHSDVAQPICGLAILAMFKGQYGKSEALFQQAQTIIEQSQGPEHPDLIGILTNYAKLLRRLKRIDEAAVLEDRVRAIEAKLKGIPPSA